MLVHVIIVTRLHTMKRLSTVFLLGILLFNSCNLTEYRKKAPENVEAYVAVYASSGDLSITGESPRGTVSPGKIYATDRYIFQNDIQNGIHVMDRSSDPPQKIAFLQIPFSTELAVRGNILYTNYISDLITIDIKDPLKPVLLNRIKEAFPPVNQDYPPYNGYFVCPDKSRGIIAYWDFQKVEKANCSR